MPCGPSCRGRSLIPLAHPKFVRGRKNPASRGRKCGSCGDSEVLHQRPAKDNSGKPWHFERFQTVRGTCPEFRPGAHGSCRIRALKGGGEHGERGENRSELAPDEDRLGAGW